MVVVTHELPYPPRAGNQYRINRYVRWLSERGNQVLTLFCPLEAPPDIETLEGAAAELGNLIVCERDGRVRACVSPRWQAVLKALEGRAVEPVSLGLDRFDDESEEDFRYRVHQERSFCPDALARLVIEVDGALESPAVLIANYVWSTRYLPLLREETFSIVDTHDMFSTKRDKVDALGVSGELMLSPEQERQLLLRADRIMAIQVEEARAFSELVPERPVMTVGVDFDLGEAMGESGSNGARRGEAGGGGAPVFGIVGSGNAMNVKGLNDFLRYAWEHVRRRHPGARLLVAGGVSRAIPKDVAGVERLGFVEVLPEFYGRCDVILNPTAAGTGLKIKTVEAIAHGRRIVAWPNGVDGVSESLRTYCLVARDWYEFVMRVDEAVEVLEESGGEFDDSDRARVYEELFGDRVYAGLGDLVDEQARQGQRREHV